MCLQVTKLVKHALVMVRAKVAGSIPDDNIRSVNTRHCGKIVKIGGT